MDSLSSEPAGSCGLYLSSYACGVRSSRQGSGARPVCLFETRDLKPLGTEKPEAALSFNIDTSREFPGYIKSDRSFPFEGVCVYSIGVLYLGLMFTPPAQR